MLVLSMVIGPLNRSPSRSPRRPFEPSVSDCSHFRNAFAQADRKLCIIFKLIVAGSTQGMIYIFKDTSLVCHYEGKNSKTGIFESHIFMYYFFFLEYVLR